MQRYFQISCHALMISAFFGLVLTGRLDSPAIVIFTIGLGVSVYWTVKGLPAPLSSHGAFVLSSAYILFFLFDSAIISRSFIPASIHLVLFLQLLKLFQEKTDKDYLYLIILSFLQILAASSLTVNISFAATLFLFLVALVSTLMSFDMYRSERNTAATAERVTAPLTGMSLWAAVWIVVTGAVLFLVIPRSGSGYFTRATAQSVLMFGFTDSVQLGEIGQVKLSSAVVMHARQISGTPFAVFKWRGIALDRFDGHNWFKTDRKHFLLQSPPGGQYWIRPVVQARDTARYEILLEPLATTTLFGPHQVRAISGNLEGLEYDADDSVYLRFPTARRIQYRVLSEIPARPRMIAVGAQEDPIPPDIGARYLQLPRDLDPRVIQLAGEITAKGKATIEKASLVETYLKRNYLYSLNLAWTPGRQPLSTFLFEAKSGHCEYFASSMAILLRAAGIPTRLINGFLMGEYNPVGRDYIIRESDAHSWVEVYIPGRGWMEFDPTPPDANHQDYSFAMQMAHYADAMELFWNSSVIVYDSGAQMQLFRSAQDRVQLLQATFRDKSDQWSVRGQQLSDRWFARINQLVEAPALWPFAAFFVLAGTVYKYRRSLKTQLQVWRVRRGRAAVDDDLVEQLFYRAARLVEGRAKKRAPAETWREWIFGLPDANRRSILTKGLEVFERSKYGRMPVSAADFAVLEDIIRQLKGAGRYPQSSM